MKIEINLDPDILIEDLDSILEELDKACQDVVMKGCLKVEADAKRNAPVNSGRLRDSIGSVFDMNSPNYSGTVGSDVYYA